MYLKAAIGAGGKPTAWLRQSVFPPITSIFDVNAVYGDPVHLAQGWVDMPFDVPNLRIENGPARAHIRIGWLRSVANIYHAFAIQSFIDELAVMAGRDQIEYFLDVLGSPRTIDFKDEEANNPNYGKPLDQYPWETGRLRRVIEVVAEKSGWANRKPEKGRVLGFAAHRSFLSYVAAVVDVQVDDQGRISIPRVDVAVDAGRVVHPERVRAQFEVAAVFAASISLMWEITASHGRVQQSNFNCTYTFLFNKLRQAGYTRSQTILKRYLRSLRRKQTDRNSMQLLPLYVNKIGTRMCPRLAICGSLAMNTSWH